MPLSKAQLRELAEKATVPVTVLPAGKSNNLSGKAWKQILTSPGKADLGAVAYAEQEAERKRQAAYEANYHRMFNGGEYPRVT